MHQQDQVITSEIFLHDYFSCGAKTRGGEKTEVGGIDERESDRDQEFTCQTGGDGVDEFEEDLGYRDISRDFIMILISLDC